MEGVSRDELLVQSVQDMKELGMFSQELSIYGCAFWYKEAVWYALSASSDKLYQWKYQRDNLTKQITAVHQLSRRTLVPAGMEMKLTETLKIAMLRLLSETYPAAYFAAERRDMMIAADDRDAKALAAIRYQLEGSGGKEALSLYQTLVSRSYVQKHLLEPTYDKLCRWIEVTRADWDEEMEHIAGSAKVFYGLGYQAGDGSWQIVADGSASKVYRLLEEKQQEGLCTTPVLAKTFYYHHPDTVADARQRSRDYFAALFSQTYQQMLEVFSDAEGALRHISR